jgi:hypothetical protein
LLINAASRWLICCEELATIFLANAWGIPSSHREDRAR